MTEPIIPYLKKLMAIADMADGRDDHQIDKKLALGYLSVLAERAGRLNCETEKRLLQDIRSAVASMKGDTFDSAEPRGLVPNFLINDKLVAELNKTEQGRHLLEWKEVPPNCAGMDYSLPSGLGQQAAKQR